MEFADLLDGLSVEGPLPSDGDDLPLGTAWLPERERGIELEPWGFVEDEFIVSGTAERWTWDERFQPVPVEGLPFRTRVLVRRPADPRRFSGCVQLEPHHPDDDQALSWAALAPWILRSGHAHVGITQEPATVPDLIAWDPERYGSLHIEHPTQRWDIVGQIAAGVVRGSVPAFADLDVDRLVMSGWSMTGTFCRTFLGEGFHARCQVDGAPVISGYVICISSGGAGRAGYGSLAEGRVLPPDDPRRTVGGHGCPIFELLSEGESETHLEVLRDDGDAPEDTYRLYQVAGSGHVIGGRRSLVTNHIQREQRGAPHALREIVEPHSDARMDLVARAAFAAMDRRLISGSSPPRTERFRLLSAHATDSKRATDPVPAEASAPRGMMPEALPLERDEDGNVLGGVRTPWVEVPAATYVPHSTPVPGRCQPAAHAPYSDPRLLADLIAHMEPFGAAEMRARYGTREGYLEGFAASARECAAAGWLLEADLPELLADRRAGTHDF